MTPPNRHRILRQVLELDLGPGADGPQLQAAVASYWRERVLPELERLFDRVAGPGELLRLERLEIALGRIQGPDWESQFRRRLVEQIARSLARFRPVAQTGDGAAGHASGEVAEPLRQWLFFLAQGRLPWWGAKPGQDWPEALLAGLDETGWAALHRLLHEDPRARRRLIDGAGDDFLAAAFTAFTGVEGALPVLQSLTAPGLPAAAGRQWRRDFWIILLDRIMADGWPAGRGAELMQALLAQRAALIPPHDGPGPGAHPDPTGAALAAGLPPVPQPWGDWLAAAREQYPRSDSAPVVADGGRSARPTLGPDAASVGSAVRTANPAPSGIGGIMDQTPRPVPGPRPGLVQLAPSDTCTTAQTPETGYAEVPALFSATASCGELDRRAQWPPVPLPIHLDSARVSPPPAAASRRGGAGRRETVPSREEEAIYLDGVGVVILHPFLEELFRDRGLLEGRNFRDATARGRAVHLLGLLCRGYGTVPEYDLLLPKLLCGLPFAEPLEPAEPDDADRDACGCLLRAVLGHWSALRSDSPDWLREQFFLREGKLEPVDAGWRLTVEGRAQDVLLARLPWGLGVIGWPWMPGRLYVRWLT